jgi:hypothetical protein
MADNITLFQETHPSLESYWRSVILFGRNVASYKFALAKSLLEIAPTGRTEITLEALAEPFSRYLCEHIAHSPRQATSRGSAFLYTCRSYNDGLATRDALLHATVKNGFNNVIDAFHIVGNRALPVQFYTKDYTGSARKIILTDEIFRLRDAAFFANFTSEAEARWRLVETAWEQQISTGLLAIEYSEIGDLLSINTKNRRKTVTSARAALNGYQKGKCFYCHADISIGDSKSPSPMIRPEDHDYTFAEPDHPQILLVSERAPSYGADTSSLCDVDHFFPYTLQRYLGTNLNGIWNLVLTCKHCNRGENGKSARVPALKYLERLHTRNEFLINSHHPLRETLMSQTGATTAERISFLRGIDAGAVSYLIHRWETEAVGEEGF